MFVGIADDEVIAAEITATPEAIPSVGVEELKIILQRLHFDPDSSLEETRPPLLRKWFQVIR